MREQALRAFAAESAEKMWSKLKCRVEASALAIDVALAGNLTSRKAINTMSGELQLAGHADVRNEFERLAALRDEIWSIEVNLLREALHGPSQVLIDMMRRQKRPAERHHVASAQTYIRYLRKRFSL
jgi:hypothetical protein